MMAVRERAVKVMAALERRVPSLDDFVGQSWSTWAERAGVTASDGADVEECGKNGKKAAEAMSLSKEDMSIFGHYPGQDDFYLVVCSHCGQVVKPQAFEKHCERRHGPLAKVYARRRSPAPTPAPQPQQRPRHGHSHSPSHAPSAPPASSWEGRGAPGLGPPPPSSRAAPPSPSTPPQYRHSKSSKEGVRHSPLEKSSHSSSSSSRVESPAFKPPPPLDPPLSSPPLSLRDPPWPHGGTTTPPGRQSPVERAPASIQKKDPGTAPGAAPGVAAHRVPRPYNKVASNWCLHRTQTGRECDLDKHCGVLDPDRKKVCTRLLTCNIHSIHQRRKVPGRSKNFDQLVAELKTKVREKGPQALDGSLSSGLPSSPEAPREPTGAPHCRRPLANLPAFSRSRASSESAPEEEKSRQDDGSLGAPSPLVQGPLSSDDSDGEGAEEPAQYPSSASHPRPLAVCSFGSHALGHGVYTFDRRLHHLRSALSSMLEQHISAHLWKKIPQAQDLQSHHPPARTMTSSPSSTSSSSSSSSLHSKFRTGSHISSSLKNSSSSSRGLGRPSGQSENSSSGGSSSGSSGHSSAAPRPPGLGRPKNPVGRPSKQMLKQREEAVAAAAALRKRKAPSQEGEHSGPDRNCFTPQDRGRPPPSPFASAPSPSSSKTATVPSPLTHGQTNGTLSPGGKPRPQPSPSESHSPAAAAAWSYKRTHPPATGHPSPAEATPTHAATNSHSRGLGGESGLHGRPSSRDFEHRAMVKKRKAGNNNNNNGEHSPPTKPSAPRPPSSSSASSSSSPRSNFYPWKESKGGPLEKKLGTQKPKLHH